MRIRAQALADNFRITSHAHQAMNEENVTLEGLLQTIVGGQILEDYPEHRRGACCLLNGQTEKGRPLHVVCTTTAPVLVIIRRYPK
ncbi:MAG: DUF4258 domain-containing protein [Chloroflexota bacterium]